MTSWHSYPKIFSLGHAALEGLFRDSVIVEEKIDGSQISFGVFKEDSGEAGLRIKSKGATINAESPESLFDKAVEYLKSVQHLMVSGYAYRAEYLRQPKHNTLAYDRTPQNNLIIFDINPAQESYLSHKEKTEQAKMLGLETVPLLYSGFITNPDQLKGLLETTSCLGGQKIEGVVVKNYSQFGKDGHVLMGKHVSERFREAHQVEWKTTNQKQGNVLANLIDRFKTPARWDKAIIHLKEQGRLMNEPRDIGPLLEAVQEDTKDECEAEIKEILFSWACPHLLRGVTHGFPEYYKNKLLESAFKETPGGEVQT